METEKQIYVCSKVESSNRCKINRKTHFQSVDLTLYEKQFLFFFYFKLKTDKREGEGARQGLVQDREMKKKLWKNGAACIEQYATERHGLTQLGSARHNMVWHRMAQFNIIHTCNTYKQHTQRDMNTSFIHEIMQCKCATSEL